ncbi:MAG: hypothetical protein IKC69_01780 [Clostridia bacterium]|nr:hypothetical protein [Clostridia bacterium]
MKNTKFLRLFSVSLASVLLASSLFGCVEKKESETETKGQSESKTLEAVPVTTATKNDELSDQLSFAFEYRNESTDKWEAVSESTSLFDIDSWEPGSATAVYLKVQNTSLIGFDWTLSFGSADGDAKLAEAIEVFTKSDDADFSGSFDRHELTGGAYLQKGTMNTLSGDNASPVFEDYLEAGDTKYLALVLKRSESAGNEYQGLKLENFKVTFRATERFFFATCTDANSGNGFRVTVQNSDEEFESVLPGDTLEMTPSVRNSGSYQQYLRVTLTVSDLAAFQQDLGADWSAESLFVKPAWADASVLKLESVSVKDDCAVLVFYASEMLAPGASITLYEGVSIPTELTANTVGTSSLKDGFTVKAFAEAVFTSNTAIQDAKSAFEYAASKQ